MTVLPLDVSYDGKSTIRLGDIAWNCETKEKVTWDGKAWVPLHPLKPIPFEDLEFGVEYGFVRFELLDGDVHAVAESGVCMVTDHELEDGLIDIEFKGYSFELEEESEFYIIKCPKDEYETGVYILRYLT